MPRGSPAWPARTPSSEAVPVEVVGRPSMGEGRVPGTAGVGAEAEAGGEDGDSNDSASSAPPAGARVSATLRFRNAMSWGW